MSHDMVSSQDKANKKDGYRQQNVRQRQKLISIIDYEFMTSIFWSICSHFGDFQRQRMA